MVIKKQDNPKKGEERGTHSPNRQDGDLRSDNKPDPAISHDVQSSADEKRAPDGQNLAEQARHEADGVAKVLGDAEHGELLLVVAQRALYDGRNAPEQVPDARPRLQPHCGHEH